MMTEKMKIRKSWSMPPDAGHITGEVVRISPKIAEKMLARNTQNRPVSRELVRKLRKKIKDGKWVFTHQGIAFDWDGHLIDGQHRLKAIIDADSGGVDMVVTYNLDPKSFEDMDVIQRTRKASDLLGIRMGGPVKYLKEKASVARAMLLGLEQKGQGGVEVYDVAEFAQENLELISEFQEAFALSKTRMVRRAPIIAAFANAARVHDRWPGGHGARDKDTVLMAAMRIAAQEWHQNGDPLKVLFNRFLEAEMGKSPRSKLDSSDYYALSVGALRNDMAGRKMFKGGTPTVVDWGDVNDHGGPIAKGNGRRIVDKTRVESMRAGKAEEAEKDISAVDKAIKEAAK